MRRLFPKKHTHSGRNECEMCGFCGAENLTRFGPRSVSRSVSRWSSARAPPEDRVGVGLPSFTRSIGGGGVSISATNYDT